MSFIKDKYSSEVGIYPSLAEIAATSADAKNTLLLSPNRFGKFLVEVETTDAPSSTLAWFPIQSEQPGTSVLSVSRSKAVSYTHLTLPTKA